MSSHSRPRILGLYRELLRDIERLPSDVREYYYRYTKQNFISHKDEVDPERLDQIIARSREHSRWIQEKVRGANEISLCQGKAHREASN
mmetsp:Transcript_3607/g.10838  ORF Transcript_3607/g.10838 Transcript_3607/m.10838 type:complete len:89 (+) Transcript_3607:132-398(+)